MLFKKKPEDIQELLEAPALLTLLSVEHDGMLSKAEKKEAIKLTHIKSYSSPEGLVDYYRVVDNQFADMLAALDAQLPAGKKERNEVLIKKLNQVKTAFRKLDPKLQRPLYHSLKSYLLRIPRVNKSILEEIVFPVLIDFVDKKTVSTDFFTE